MISQEVADICKIVDKSWPDMDESDFKVVLEIAQDIYNAGYRRSPQETASE